MSSLPLSSLITRSIELRTRYHVLERKLLDKEWTVEEDALAFLTDAGLVGRMTMAQQKRWPGNDDNALELKNKLGECMWWLTVLANRMDIDIGDAVEEFLSSTEKKLGNS